MFEKLRGSAEAWHELRTASNLDERSAEVLPLLEAADHHVERVQRPSIPRRDVERDTSARQRLEWRDLPGVFAQRLYMGHVSAGVSDHYSAAAAATDSEQSGEGGAVRDAATGDVDGDAGGDGIETALQCASGRGSETGCETAGPRGFELESQHLGELWREDSGSRHPSLRPPDEASMHTAGYTRLELSLSAELAAVVAEERGQLEQAEQSATVWGWHGSRADGTSDASPVAQLYRRAWQLDSMWAPGVEAVIADRGWSQALWRGLSPEQYAQVTAGRGIAARLHRGGLEQHAIDIAEGSRRATAGVSLSKDPFIAARYGAQSKGHLVCLNAAELLRPGSACDAAEAQVDNQGMALKVSLADGNTALDVQRAHAGTIDLSTAVGGWGQQCYEWPARQSVRSSLRKQTLSGGTEDASRQLLLWSGQRGASSSQIAST